MRAGFCLSFHWEEDRIGWARWWKGIMGNGVMGGLKEKSGGLSREEWKGGSFGG